MKRVLEHIFLWGGVMFLGILLGATINYATAWVEPNEMPPGGNIAAPLNTSDVGQVKLGGLTLNISGATYGLLVNKGLVGIGTNTPKAILDVNSTTSGFLPPRMTTNQINAIESPQLGMMVFNTDTKKVNSYNGSAWEEVRGGTAGGGDGGNFDGNLNGNLNVNGDAHANNYFVNNTNSSFGQNGLCMGGSCQNSWGATAGAQWEWNCDTGPNWAKIPPYSSQLATACSYDIVLGDPNGDKNYINSGCVCHFSNYSNYLYSSNDYAIPLSVRRATTILCSPNNHVLDCANSCLYFKFGDPLLRWSGNVTLYWRC